MIRRDFVLRLIEQLGAIARALISGERGEISRAAAEAALADAAEQGLGLSLQTLRALGPQSLVQLFRSGGAIGNSRIALAAAIYRTEAKIAASSGEASRATACAQKALYLLEQIRSDPVSSEQSSIEQHRSEMLGLLRTSASA